MKILFLVHSISSCWNNGNAHFLRGVMSALVAAGHEAMALEPERGWSRSNLLKAHPAASQALAEVFPELDVVRWRLQAGALDRVAEFEPDLVIVHEWTPPALVNALGRLRSQGARYTLLFHDTHHRAVTRPAEMAAFDLSGYDGVLAFGACLAEVYRKRGWGRQVFVWHEAADIRRFRPRRARRATADVAWVGNWGDGERSEEIQTFLLDPVRELGLQATVHGVRYPPEAVEALSSAGVAFAGWLPNHQVPECFSRHRATVHIPRRPYAAALPGIPTIRMFEALACGIPLVSAPWSDVENLFPSGCYLKARDGEEMARHLHALLHDCDLADGLSAAGWRVIEDRHSCDHRAAELLALHASLSSSRNLAEVG